ncbi:hypothetical protein N4R57_19025 [Rhodobacteraceae bacterium D3-12]|nr:hypothetical protein N4R57_19025 [Rhodobacteraceae bacterium D3-12]
MKYLMTAMAVVLAGPVGAAVSGFYDSAEKIDTILSSPEVADRLRQAPLRAVENTGARADGAQEWTLHVQRCDLKVYLVPMPPPPGAVGKTRYRVELGEGCE